MQEEELRTELRRLESMNRGQLRQIDKLKTRMKTQAAVLGIVGAIAGIFLAGGAGLFGLAWSVYARVDDKANAANEKSITTTEKLETVKANIRGVEQIIDRVEKLIGKLETTVERVREGAVAMSSPAVRTCGKQTSYGFVTRLTADGFVMQTEVDGELTFVVRDSTVIADIAGAPRTRTDIKVNTNIALCYDIENGAMKAVKVNILPKAVIETPAPPLNPMIVPVIPGRRVIR